MGFFNADKLRLTDAGTLTTLEWTDCVCKSRSLANDVQYFLHKLDRDYGNSMPGALKNPDGQRALRTMKSFYVKYAELVKHLEVVTESIAAAEERYTIDAEHAKARRIKGDEKVSRAGFEPGEQTAETEQEVEHADAGPDTGTDESR